MNVIFEYHDVSASERLEALTVEKLNAIAKKYPFVIRGDVFFKKENTSDNSGHECGIRLSAPGPRIYATSRELSFEAAINETIRDLNDQLEKRKSKMQQH